MAELNSILESIVSQLENASVEGKPIGRGNALAALLRGLSLQQQGEMKTMGLNAQAAAQDASIANQQAMPGIRSEAQQQLIAATEQQRRQTMITRAQAEAEAQTFVKVGQLTSAAVKSGIGQATRLDGPLLVIQNQLRALGPAGTFAADGLKERVDANANARAELHLSELKNILKMSGQELPTDAEEAALKVIKNKVERGADPTLAALGVARETAAKAEKADAEAANRGMKVYPALKQAGGGRGGADVLGRAVELEGKKLPPNVLADELSNVVHETAKKGRWKGAGLALGGAALAMVASKLMAGKEDGGPELSPEMRMALAAKLQQSQQGDQDESGAGMGRGLLNLSRGLAVVKMLQDMQGMAPQQAQVARLI